jgi:hypothetical protein
MCSGVPRRSYSAVDPKSLSAGRDGHDLDEGGTMRVGILTYHFSDNYGALMQAYGLRTFLRRQGFDAQFINYHPRYVEEGGLFDAPLDVRKWRKNATILYMKVMHTRRRLFGDRAQRAAFEAFRRNVLGVTGLRIETAEGLRGIDMPEILVCGSDQIWNPSAQRGLDPVYFLAFPGSKTARRVSYAASFGRAELDPNYHAEAGALIRELDGISVREESGVAIVAQVSGRQAVGVLDPSLLLGDFDDLLAMAGPVPSNHVFCYALRSAAGISQVAKHAGTLLSAPVLSPYNVNRRWAEIGTTIYPNPVDWIAYLNAAEVVVSNSFHGVAVAIALRKPFLSVPLAGNKRGLSERVVNLLRQLDLEHRIVSETDEASVARTMNAPIDWESVEAQVAELRRRGSDFLLSNLRMVKKDV